MGHLPFPGVFAYGTAKHALGGMCLVLLVSFRFLPSLVLSCPVSSSPVLSKLRARGVEEEEWMGWWND